LVGAVNAIELEPVGVDRGWGGVLPRPADDTGAFHGLTFDDALAPKRIEERNEGQAKGGEIGALDLLEQLEPERLDLIGADRAQHLFASGGEVAAYEFGRELAHGKRGHRGLGPDRLAIGRDRYRSMQRVGLAPEIEQLATRGLHALGLAHY